MKRWIATISVVLAFGAGCAKTGSVTEKQPLTQDLSSYRSASIEVDMPSSVKNAETEKTSFVSTIGEKLRERKIFAEVLPGGADMTLRVKVTSLDSGDKGLQALGPSAGGDSQVQASVELFDTKQNKAIGAFDVAGNSKKNTQMSVGGVNTAAMEDTTARALAAAADEIAAYLEKHRGAAK